MTRLAYALLISSLIFPAAFLHAQSRSDTDDKKFWQHFEDEVNGFVNNVLEEFRAAPKDSQPRAQSLRLTERNDLIISRDSTIAAGDTLNCNVTVRRCSLVIAGVLNGNIAATRGSVHVLSGGHVMGDVRITDGSFTLDDGGIVDGALDKRFSWTIDEEDYQGTWHAPSPSPSTLPWLRESMFPQHIDFRFNRVEGLFLGLGSKKRFAWNGERSIGAYGSVGYGFKAHHWRYNLGLTRQFAFVHPTTDHLLEFGIEGYSLTDTKDQWLIGMGENTAAALLIHEDFRDYFSREGATLHASYYIRGDDLFAEGRLAFLADRYGSLDQRTDWSLFGGDKVFRPNPAIDGGAMRSVIALAGFSTAQGKRWGPDGWSAFASAEFASAGALGGDFTFHQYLADIRRYQVFGRYESINVRFRIGTSTGDTPRQKSFALGGLSTLPAYGFKIFPGDSLGSNRLILLNAEYIVNGDLFGELDFWPSWILRSVNLLFLADAGLTRTVDSRVSALGGFGGIHWQEFRSDLGLGIGNRSGSFRLAVMWRTDRSESPRFIFRFSRPF